MRLWAGVFTVLLAAAVPAAGQESPWCYRQHRSAATVCSFSTMEECVRSSLILGGICERRQDLPAELRKPGAAPSARKKG